MHSARVSLLQCWTTAVEAAGVFVQLVEGTRSFQKTWQLQPFCPALAVPMDGRLDMQISKARFSHHAGMSLKI